LSGNDADDIQPEPVLPAERTPVLSYEPVLGPVEYMPPLFEDGKYPYHRTPETASSAFMKTVLVTSFIAHAVAAFQRGYPLADVLCLTALNLVLAPLIFAGLSTALLSLSLWFDRWLRPGQSIRKTPFVVATACLHTALCVVSWMRLARADIPWPPDDATLIWWLLPPIVVPVVAPVWLNRRSINSQGAVRPRESVVEAPPEPESTSRPGTVLSYAAPADLGLNPATPSAAIVFGRILIVAAALQMAICLLMLLAKQRLTLGEAWLYLMLESVYVVFSVTLLAVSTALWRWFRGYDFVDRSRSATTATAIVHGLLGCALVVLMMITNEPLAQAFPFFFIVPVIAPIWLSRRAPDVEEEEPG